MVYEIEDRLSTMNKGLKVDWIRGQVKKQQTANIDHLHRIVNGNVGGRCCGKIFALYHELERFQALEDKIDKLTNLVERIFGNHIALNGKLEDIGIFRKDLIKL